MPIQVTCPSCLKRFQVSEKFAGQTGPCPACKKPITIPKSDDVVIHAPDDALGPKDAKGRPVLKTVRSSDAVFNPMVAGIVGVVVVVLIGAAVVLRGDPQTASSLPVLAIGAVLLGPLVAWAGYTFLRELELEPYSGTTLLLRCLGCGVGFAAGWLVFWILAAQLGGSWTLGEMNPLQLVFVTAVSVGIAAFAAFVALDLDPTNAAIHAAMYFGCAVLLRLAMGLPALPGLAPGIGG